jgi:putative tricarboxylic transport membrane protein
MGRDKWSSLVWCGMGIFICVGSLRLSLGELHHPGPGFLSFYAGLILGVLALVIHLQSRKAPSAHKRAEPEPIWRSGQRGWKMVMTVGALLAYAVLMNYLGFLISTFVFLAFLLRVIEPQRWSVALLGSLAASVAFYCVFEMGLKSQLPKGLIRIFY